MLEKKSNRLGLINNDMVVRPEEGDMAKRMKGCVAGVVYVGGTSHAATRIG